MILRSYILLTTEASLYTAWELLTRSSRCSSFSLPNFIIVYCNADFVPDDPMWFEDEPDESDLIDDNDKQIRY